MAPSARDRISVDLRGLKAALFEQAHARGTSPYDLVRELLAGALVHGDLPVSRPSALEAVEPAEHRTRLSLSLSLCMSCADAVSTLSAARGAGLAPGAFVAGLVASSAELSGLSRNRIVKVAQQPKLAADLAKMDVAASDLALRRPCCAARRQTEQARAGQGCHP